MQCPYCQLPRELHNRNARDYIAFVNGKEVTVLEFCSRYQVREPEDIFYFEKMLINKRALFVDPITETT